MKTLVASSCRLHLKFQVIGPLFEGRLQLPLCARTSPRLERPPLPPSPKAHCPPGLGAPTGLPPAAFPTLPELACSGLEPGGGRPFGWLAGWLACPSFAGGFGGRPPACFPGVARGGCVIRPALCTWPAFVSLCAPHPDNHPGHACLPCLF